MQEDDNFNNVWLDRLIIHNRDDTTDIAIYENTTDAVLISWRHRVLG